MATKKKLKKMMEAVVKEMPLVMNSTKETHHVSGAELLEQGHDKEEIDPEKTYKQDMPVLIAVNHKRRLKRAFAQHGQRGVTEYLASITKIVKQDGNQNS